jgi:uncharacterized protein (DUF1697 family)
MFAMRYVALLRGINVGGNNLIKMIDLKACMEANGFGDVTTYIQSGNVLFTAPASPSEKLTRQIEKILTHTFKYTSSVVLRSQKQMQDVVERAPDGYGTQPTKYRYDVLFLKSPLTASTAMKSVLIKEGVDEAHAGPGVLYFSRLDSRATQSYLNKIASMPVYKNMTLRNWNTTTKLLKMM